MNTQRYGYRNQRNRRARLCSTLRIVLVVCLIAGVFGQITMIAKLADQSKQISKVNREIRDMTATVENMQVCLSMYQNLDRIETLAYGLGMQLPDQEQIRVVSLPGIAGDTSTQTAENTEVEFMIETSMR